MAVTDLKKMLTSARDGGYAVGAFNVENMEFVQAVIRAAEEERAPVIVQTSVNTLRYASPAMFFAMVDTMAAECGVPVAIHLDHGERREDIMACVRSGYRSVMFDGSLLPYAENVEETRQIVEICKALGVSVEAELGAIAGKKNAPAHSKLLYTHPETAADFIERTGADALAVAIGTAHGIYKDTPKLDYERLDDIRRAVDTPLVLHGASGLSDEQTRECVRRGITKVNIATELRIAWTETIRREQAADPAVFDPKKAAGKARDAVKEIVKEKIRVLGGGGKA